MQSTAIALPRVLTLEDIARHVGLHVNTVRRLAASGELKTRRIGRRIFVAEDDARAFLTGVPASPQVQG